MRKRASRKLNPEGAKSAKQMSEKFHGRAVDQVIDIEEVQKEPSNYAELGILKELRLQDQTYEYVISFNDTTVSLASDGSGEQLYFIGGNQNLDTLLKDIGVKAEISHRFVNLGFVSGIVYETDKHHLEDSDGEVAEYDHEFGEEGGTFPILIYDTLNKRMLLAGGTYKVKDVGIWN
jgi:hypothetical protein